MAPDDRDDTLGTLVDGSAATVGATSPAATGDAPLGLSRYKLGAVLGRGGMGEVVSAHDEQIGRSVAIKRMRAADPTPDAVARFLREAQIQGCLEHPAIVPVHELSRDTAGAPFFVMKQLAGVTLAEVIERLEAGDCDAKTRADFTRQRLLRAFAEVCLAVEFAHTRGIVHRDLKPANIVLGEFGEVFVLDWGIARVAEESRAAFGKVDTLEETGTVAGAILGTPGYMSPEQIDGAADLDGRADVYALGCILFEILALQPLHVRGTAGLASALAGVDAHPSRRTPDRDIAPELDAACVTATALMRSSRHASARALGDAVQRFLDGDRDVALRAQLAREALDDAREARARDSVDEKGVAMRAAARSLALDPKGGAADFIGNLMLQPPSATPPEVELLLAEQELDRKVESRRLMSIAGVVYVSFLPLLWWSGFAAQQLALVALAAGAMIAIGALVDRRTLAVMSVLAIIVHALTIVLAARLASPYLLAPALTVITVMAMAMQRLGNPLALAGLFSVVLVGPWICEQLGWLAPTMSVDGGAVVIHTAAPVLHPLASEITLSTFSIAVVTMSVVLARIMTNQRLAAQRTTEIQAWRLRQLVAG